VREGSGERLELRFSGHLVVVTGDQLTTVLPHVSTGRLGCLRDQPLPHRAGLPAHEAFIAKLEVKPSYQWAE
jgi:hypothetical protein